MNVFLLILYVVLWYSLVRLASSHEVGEVFRFFTPASGHFGESFQKIPLCSYGIFLQLSNTTQSSNDYFSFPLVSTLKMSRATASGAKTN